jgi:hypothetical protein
MHVIIFGGMKRLYICLYTCIREKMLRVVSDSDCVGELGGALVLVAGAELRVWVEVVNA